MVEKLAQYYQVTECLILESSVPISKPVFFPESCPAFVQQGFSPYPYFLLMFSVWWKQDKDKARSKEEERSNDKRNPCMARIRYLVKRKSRLGESLKLFSKKLDFPEK